MKRFILALIVLCFAFVGCAVQTAETETDQEAVASTDQAIIGGLQINEINRFGTAKFIEILNTGTSTVNLANYKILAGAGVCTMSGNLAPGAYTQARTSCTGVANCKQCATLDFANQTFSILTLSNGTVDSVPYPDALGNPVQKCVCSNGVCNTSVPALGQTWGAFPNGKDCFRVNSNPTPLAANAL